MRKRIAIAVVFLLAIGATVATSINRLYRAHAQEPTRGTGASLTSDPYAQATYGQAATGYYGYAPIGVSNSQSGALTPTAPTRAMSAEEAQEAQEFQELIAKMRNPGEGESVDEIREQMKTLLSLQLDRDLAQREESLKEIEKRASQLRQQLEARRESKPETLKLLMTMVENPSAGFGLPDHWMRMLMPTVANPYSSRAADVRQAYTTEAYAPPPYSSTFNSEPAIASPVAPPTASKPRNTGR